MLRHGQPFESDDFFLGIEDTMKKRPDALVVLAIIFATGVLVSTLTHGGNQPDLERYAQSAGVSIKADQSR